MMPNWTQQTEEQAFVLTLASSSSLAKSNQQAAAQRVSDCLLDLVGDSVPTGGLLENAHPKHVNVTQFEFSSNGPQAAKVWAKCASSISDHDVWVRPLQAAPLQLLLCDMDSTIIPTESLDELAREVGIGDQVAAITARAMNGELDFERALDERVGLLKGLDISVIDQCVAQTQINAGAEELIRTARANGVFAVLISGGFGPFVEHVASRLGFDRWVANTLEIENGALTGGVLPPLIDKHSKLTTLNQEIERLGISKEQSAAVGDGANDIAMLQHAGFGIAYRAKPAVLEHAAYKLQFAEFDSLLSLFPFDSRAC